MAVRVRTHIATQAVLIQAATATTGFAAGPKTHQHFQGLIKSLTGDD